MITSDGVPTLAGLLVLGRYPQQFFPQLVIRVAVAPGPEDPAGTRVSNQEVIDGPIPTVIKELTRVGLPMPRYWDTGIQFTVRLDQRRQETAIEVPTKKSKRTIQERVYEALEKQALTATEIAKSLDLPLISVRTALGALTKNGQVTIGGGRGKRSTYTRALGNLL